MKRPILAITLGFITGIILGLYFNIALFIFVFLILLIMFMKLIKIENNNTCIKVIKIFIRNNILLVFCISAFISCMYLQYCNNKYEYIYNNFKASEIIATVISNNKETEYKNTYIVKLELDEDIKLILRISKSKNIILNYGDKIKVDGKYIVPEVARNYSGFDYRRYLKTQKIYGIFETEKAEILKNDNLKFINLSSNNIKQKIIDNFSKILPKSTSQLFLGILIGYDENISEEIENSFKRSSLTHLLAVSGSHIAYIIVGSNFLFSKLKIPKKITNILTIFFLIFFMYITNFSSSVVRASIMGIVYLLSLIFHRKNDIKTTISISLILILIENPYKILDIGLLLSYLATIGIIYFSSFIKKYEELNLKEKVICYIKELALITVFANIFVIPIMAYNFNTISLTFIISNIIAGILIGPITIGGFILIIISFINLKVTYIISISYNLLLEILIHSTKLTSLIPFSQILVITPSIITVITYYMILFICISYIFIKKEYYNRYLVKRISNFIRKILKLINKNYKFIIIIIVFIFLINLILRTIPKSLKIHFIDVGQGDSTFIITPTNKKILIDSGGAETGSFDVGKSTLVPYLLDRKVILLDYICISHFDSDHCQGFIYLLNNMKVKNIIISKQYEFTNNFKEIMNIVNKKKINIIKVEAGDIVKIDNFVRFKIFSPGKNLTDDINDNSIVMKLEYNNFSCIFTGDISKQIEKVLVKKYGNILESDILKVAHHRF